jgi:hypothetical protein
MTDKILADPWESLQTKLRRSSDHYEKSLNSKGFKQTSLVGQVCGNSIWYGLQLYTFWYDLITNKRQFLKDNKLGRYWKAMIL